MELKYILMKNDKRFYTNHRWQIPMMNILMNVKPALINKWFQMDKVLQYIGRGQDFIAVMETLQMEH